MRTDLGLSGCSGFPGGNCGIFTSVSGTTPNRIFNIEWRTVLFANNASRQNFEVRLYENPAENLRFDVIYATLNTTGHDHPYVGGVQGDSGAGFFTQDFCGDTPPQNVSRTYTIPPCGTPTPTPTPTPTATPTPTPGQIVLTATAHRVNGRKVVNLTWTGANTTFVDIGRNGVVIARVQNTGSYTDVLPHHGTFTYKVCEAGTTNCSNEVTVRFGNPGP
ncbi:MAG: hypothetical protein DMG96_38645 [Acidobacteria bacterium]|nr:MAG: hypothetical protein DMG96_38645 [Acidobacteriota bacterium]